MTKRPTTRPRARQLDDVRDSRGEPTSGPVLPMPPPVPAGPRGVEPVAAANPGTPAATDPEITGSPGEANDGSPNDLRHDGAANAVRDTAPGHLPGLAVLARLLVALEHDHPPPGIDRMLYRRVRSDLMGIARDCRGTGSTDGSGPSGEATRLVTCLAPTWFGGGSADPVLRMVLAAHAGADGAYQQWETPAWQAYLAHPSGYRQILGDLIPTDFVSDAAAELARVAFAHGTNPTAADDWQVYLERRLARQGAESRAVTTGLPALDDMLGGGLRGLTFLGGRTGVGKTSLATFIVGAALRESAEVAALYLQLDMYKEAIYGQIFSAQAAAERTRRGAESVPSAAGGLVALRPPEHLRRLRVLERRNLPGRCAHEEWQDVMCEYLTDAINGLQRRSGARTVLLVVDNFQRIDVPGVADDLERDVLRLDLLTRVLSATACDLHPGGMPILAISKIPKGRGPTNLEPDDLHGDSDLASRASSVVFLEPDPSRKTAPPGVAPLIVNVAKGRDGVTRGPLPVDFRYRDYSFREFGISRPGHASQIQQLLRSRIPRTGENNTGSQRRAVE